MLQAARGNGRWETDQVRRPECPFARFVHNKLASIIFAQRCMSGLEASGSGAACFKHVRIATTMIRCTEPFGLSWYDKSYEKTTEVYKCIFGPSALSACWLL